MIYTEKFTDTQLQTIIEEGLIYMCACPAQVAQNVRTVRELYFYQQNCLENKGNDSIVHKTIAEYAIKTHAQLEECMEKILELENWDKETLSMPANLRVKQMEVINGEDV